MELRDIFAVIADRRSTKQFTSQPVEVDKILQVIQAGTMAPSSGNIQNWSFVVVTDIDQIRNMYEYTLNQEPFLSAMAAVIVCGDVEYAHTMYGMRGKRLYTIQNCAAATENMLLAAHALGLGASWIGAFDEDKISLMFGIPQSQHRPQAIILLGYAVNGDVEPKHIKELPDVVFFNKYGSRALRPHLMTYDWAQEWRLQGQKIKSHLSHAKETVFGVQREKVVETMKHSSHSAKEHVNRIINSMKKEGYRK
jgi:nitroreductase